MSHLGLQRAAPAELDLRQSFGDLLEDDPDGSSSAGWGACNQRGICGAKGRD